MKKVSRSYKWHYFNSDDELCYYEFGVFDWEKEKIYSSACGMPRLRMKKHTEFKNRVTCLSCLKVLNREDNLNFKIT